MTVTPFQWIKPCNGSSGSTWCLPTRPGAFFFFLRVCTCVVKSASTCKVHATCKKLTANKSDTPRVTYVEASCSEILDVQSVDFTAHGNSNTRTTADRLLRTDCVGPRKLRPGLCPSPKDPAKLQKKKKGPAKSKAEPQTHRSAKPRRN